jgi:hypothetical protein
MVPLVKLVLQHLRPVPTSQQACSAGQEASWVAELRSSAGLKRWETARSVRHLPQSATGDVRAGNPSVRLNPEATSGQSRMLPFTASPFPLIRSPGEKAPGLHARVSRRSRMSCRDAPPPRGDSFSGCSPRGLRRGHHYYVTFIDALTCGVGFINSGRTTDRPVPAATCGRGSSRISSSGGRPAGRRPPGGGR